MRDALRPFRYKRPEDADSAVALLAAAPEGMFLGGGTNLVDLMRLGVEAPATLIDVSRLADDLIEPTDDGGLRIGAGVPNSGLAAHPLVRKHYPLLSLALLHGASGQLRNLATVAGNLLQRTRCMYFQDVTKACNKRSPGSGCSAIDGAHRNHAILGVSEHCAATHPSDMAVALAALDATVQLVGPDAPRSISVLELHRVPGEEPQRDTTLRPGELIVSVELPPPWVSRRAGYAKVRERASFAFAVVSVAAALDLEDGIVRDVRIALGGVAHKPWRAHWAEQSLRGAAASEENFTRAAEAELGQATPLRDNAYKVPLARNLITSTLTDLLEMD